jgi:tetratricopeptide (TPR) repeat protein
MRCLYPWTQAYISATGIVKPCCSNIELGNLRDSAVLDVLAGTNMRALRTAMAAQAEDDLPHDCVGCFELAKQGSLHEFHKVYWLGPDVEKELRDLEAGGHREFARNYRVLRDCYERGVHPPAGTRPLGVWCQVGERCNIRCIMCWQDHEKPNNLSADQIEQVRQLIPTAHTLHITGGEPTVFGDFWKLVDCFREQATPKSRFLFLTNGLLLKNKLHRFDGIDNVTFSVNVDGPTRESYEKIRHLGKWDLLLENLEAIVEYKHKHNKRNWALGTAFTLMRSNIELLDESMRFADRFGACWICQIIGGEYYPVAQCRVYFEENIFRFDHLGFSKDDIVHRLEQLLPLARSVKNSPEVAASCVEATIALTRNTQQLHVPPEQAARLRGLADDYALSRAIKEIVDAGAGRKSIGELIQIAGLKRKQAGPDSVAAAAASLEVARGHLGQGDCAAALPHLERAHEGFRKAHGAAHPDVVDAALELGRCLSALGRSAGAEPLLRQAYAYHERADGKTHKATSAAAMALGRCLVARRRAEEAEPLLRQALASYQKLSGTESSYYGMAVVELARCLCARRQHVEAELLLREALSLYERILGMENWATAEATCLLSRCLRAQRRTADARIVLDRLVGHCRRTLGTLHPITQMTIRELGGIRGTVAHVLRVAWRAARKAARAGRALRTRIHAEVR